MKRDEIIVLARRTLRECGVKKAYLFGSFAKRKRAYRDIDIAIDPPKGATLLDLAHIENVLEKRVGRKIDLGAIDSIHPLIRRHFEAEKVALI